MTIKVEVVREVTPALVAAVNWLLPQLSSSASSLSAVDLENIVKSPATELFIATTENENIAGMLTLAIFKIPTEVRAWIEDVVVDSSVQGLGAGAALCMAAIDHAMGTGVVSVDLTSRPSRVAANRLYQKLGFQQRETNVYRYTR